MADSSTDLRDLVFAGASPDANRRVLQRVYVERLAAIVNPTPPRGLPVQAGTPTPPATPAPAATEPPNGDLPAIARLQLRQIREDARRNAAAATDVTAKAHWEEIVARVEETLEAHKR